MKTLLILIVLFAAGCGGGDNADPKKVIAESKNDIGDIEEQDVDRAYEKIIREFSLNADQIDTLKLLRHLALDGLTSITDEQAERLSMLSLLELNGLTEMTDIQAES